MAIPTCKIFYNIVTLYLSQARIQGAGHEEALTPTQYPPQPPQKQIHIYNKG